MSATPKWLFEGNFQHEKNASNSISVKNPYSTSWEYLQQVKICK